MLNKIKEYFKYNTVGELFIMASLIPLAIAAGYLFIFIALWIFSISLPLIIFWKIFAFAFVVFVFGYIIDFVIEAIEFYKEECKESKEEALTALTNAVKEINDNDYVK